MAMPADPLAALRPIRLPAPPASSLVEMLVLAAAAGIACGLLLTALLAARAALARRRSPAGEALAALAAARGLAPGERLCAQAAALRRYVAATAGATRGRIQGAAWLATLDAAFATDVFTAGAGRALGEALYQPLDGADPEALDALLRGLLRAA
ncbi:DUF4381 family protein [Labrys wisconsinensis]|uniref:Xanthosine utilization system XapX-like protein n=1 Tax=Labrys wisconsinensis TaxID=425677 RepID=A0ABU0JD92_9HYPH|nr:DUF4381 family protein [Labrys wisconsinensis]MDQ0472254.1 xanthosine utilization system XapX-like protein [Labrys wisconsinensis]